MTSVIVQSIKYAKKKQKEEKKTSDAGSQYRCRRVGKGIKPPSTPQPPQTLKQTEKVLITMTDEPTDGRTDGPTKSATKKQKRKPKRIKREFNIA